MKKRQKTITYGFYKSPFGEMVLGRTDLGLCWLGFMVNGYKGNGLERMFTHFDGAVFLHDDTGVQGLGDSIMQAWEQGREEDIALDLHGTDFQKSVWKALLKIRKGKRCAYDDVANGIGMPRAARAVGGAVGSNPVSLIVPCHRVVQKSGAIGNYGWGVELKEKILAREAA
jgi:AraC family transcriptional regulator, regulatory protein of adaptative response / methylated-DNA-[protein]-cysteine methyltransferase